MYGWYNGPEYEQVPPASCRENNLIPQFESWFSAGINEQPKMASYKAN